MLRGEDHERRSEQGIGSRREDPQLGTAGMVRRRRGLEDDLAAFAPAERPRIAVGVMFVRAGAGGATAAPAARVVLATALGK